MSRSTSTDPLVPFAVRIPSSLNSAIRDKAERSGATLADVLRAHLTLEQAKPLAVPKPRRRQPQELGKVSNDPPELLRQMSRIGLNLSEIARTASAARKAGQQFDDIKILAVLSSIDLEIKRLGVVAGVKL
ncbi:MobC family plasmid mobilization relaxosome protein [Variovorax ureilyticus]|uniref:MobC family plasmid mobilization relaxosome protein n=1 Tax=Variovorax ureilyticus TaxID=1836198 RepID=UPI003D6720B5